jgi:SAM-dependent MidA family methyltransferase
VSETPLARKLELLIQANGPMSVADYMALCLGDPAHGYYMTRDPFGSGGDFITAPEVSQMFGEIVGAWLIEAWLRSGRPTPVRLVELGPGRGTLMADILRVAAHVPEFCAAVSAHLVEMSPTLRARQAQTLASPPVAIAWHAALDDVPDGPLLLIANEFFDALPVRQFERTEAGWHERVVGLDESGRLAFGLRPVAVGPAAPPAESEEWGGVLEICPAAEALVAKIATRIATQRGAALIIDYGYEGPAIGDTLQAVSAHAFTDPLAAPGEADLTAHVDFTALAQAASEAGAEVAGPITQRDFLVSLGLRQRAASLGAKTDEAANASLQAAVERLTDADQMGALFKALAITRRGIHLPPFEAR